MEKLNPNLRKILRNIGWLLAERVFRMAVGFVVIAWMARYLGSQQFGLLNYAIALVSILSMMAKLGLNKIVVRNIVREPDCKNETLGTAFFLLVTSGIGAFFLAAIAIFFLRPDDTIVRLLVAIIAASISFEAFNTINFWFQSQVQSHYTVWAKNAAFIIITIVRVVLIQRQAPLIAFGYAALAEAILSGLSLAIAYQLTGNKIQAWRFKLPLAKALLKEGWPLILSSLAIMVYLRVDQLMFGELANEEAVGIYSAATRLSEVWSFVGLSIVNSVTASIVEAKKTSETLYYQKWQTVFNWLALIAYAIALPLTILSTPIVLFVFGSEYAASGPVLAIHIWAAIFTFLGLAKGVWAVTEGLTKYSLACSVIGAAMNIGLNLWLIPKYQAIGAAIATVVSYGFSDYVTCFIYPPARRIGWLMTKAIAFNGLTQIIGDRQNAG